MQISVTLREWDIPYGELAIGEKIGVGRIGTVYKWVTVYAEALCVLICNKS